MAASYLQYSDTLAQSHRIPFRRLKAEEGCDPGDIALVQRREVRGRGHGLDFGAGDKGCEARLRRRVASGREPPL